MYAVFISFPDNVTHITSILLSNIFDIALSANEKSVIGIDANGIDANGMDANGIDANGIHANGMSFNGMSFNGISENDMSVNGISVNGMSVKTRAEHGSSILF